MTTLTFIAVAASLLATPGPTNTLLATSGASVGVRRSLPLLVAELAGYGLAIGVLRFVLGPLIGSVPAIGTAMGLGVAIYLLSVAAALWRHGAAEVRATSPVTVRRVFTTTTLNPKASIFAFTLLPLHTGFYDLLPWLAILAMQISLIGGLWIVLGAAIGAKLQSPAHAGAGYRFSALVLVVMASIVGGHSLGLA